MKAFLIATLVSLSTFSHSLFALSYKGHSIPIQAGFFSTLNEKNQHLDIDSLIGNDYLAKRKNSTAALLGIGYFIDTNQYDKFQFAFGINAFYFFKQSMKGQIAQERLFTNLAYSYDSSNVPIYFASKTLYRYNEKYNLTVDLGVGPNIVNLSHYKEVPLNNYTLPDNAFSSNTSIRFSATAGIGLRINNLIASLPVECGYRFFYLGQGQFNKNSEQIINNLNSNRYANALICSITV
ncbi:MAG: hypothetical protein LCH30_05905 [Proteobacteria bacterium]|nr:hypothetical protein [Pseudomonadota bacterium]